jgi:putative hydrolase of the HAD superfamily
MGKRKPNADIFMDVLSSNNLNAQETLFIDDSPQHIEGALKTGIQAKLLSKNMEVEELLAELGLIK